MWINRNDVRITGSNVRMRAPPPPPRPPSDRATGEEETEERENKCVTKSLVIVIELTCTAFASCVHFFFTLEIRLIFLFNFWMLFFDCCCCCCCCLHIRWSGPRNNRVFLLQIVCFVSYFGHQCDLMEKKERKKKKRMNRSQRVDSHRTHNCPRFTK